MGKGKDGCDGLGGMGSIDLGEEISQAAIKAALDFLWGRITTYTVKADDVPEGWGLVPGFEHYPSAVGGTTARWQILVPYLLENYPDDFQLIGSEGVAVQENGSALFHSPGSQYLGVRTVYPFDHPRAGQATDGLLTAYNWTQGDGVQGELKEQLHKAQEEYNARRFRELVKIRMRREFGDLQNFEKSRQLIDDLPEDWNEQICNAVLNMPPIVWHDSRGYRNIGGNIGKASRSIVEGYTFYWQGSKIEKPVHKWNFNDDNQYVTPMRLQAAAAWCGFLKDCGPPMIALPNLVDKDDPLSLAKDDQGKMVPAEGRRQTPLNYPVDRAREILEDRGLRVETKGSGDYVIGQDPPVMGKVDAIAPGSTVTLQLGPKADWTREYVDRIPSQEDRQRRQAGGIISIKQQRLVFTKARYTTDGVTGVNRHVAQMLGIDPPEGNIYSQRNWLDKQLENFPKDKFQQLLDKLGDG